MSAPAPFLMRERAAAVWQSREAIIQLRARKALAATALAEPARGRFPYFRTAPEAKPCECRQCAMLDLLPLQGIPGARQLALPL